MVIICLVLAGIGLWMLGKKKSSRVAAFAGGLTVAAPLLYIVWNGMLLPLAPLFALGAAYCTVNKTNNG